MIYGALAYVVYKMATGDQRTQKKTNKKRHRAAGTSDPHAVLGIGPDASPEEIRRAYQDRIHAYHPDRVANAAPELRALAEERTKEINAAYAELTRRASPP